MGVVLVGKKSVNGAEIVRLGGWKKKTKTLGVSEKCREIVCKGLKGLSKKVR